MKILKPLHLLLVLGVALSSTLAFAQGTPPDKRGPKSHLQKCLTIVQLTDAQKTQVRSIMETARPKLEVLRQTMASDRQALRAAVEATPQDACAIGAAFVKVQGSKTAIRSEHEAVRAAVQALLTPEQQARLEGCLQAPRGDGPPND
jgi:periplasmic protein CpxP/Spy